MNATDLKIGLLLPTWEYAMDGVTPSTRDILDIAQLAEQVGFDTLWSSDHLLYEPYDDFRVVGVEFSDEYAGVKTGSWECWTLIAALAAVTQRATLGTLVSNTGFRNPALLARMVDTVDDLAGGRLILGLGAGDFATEHEAFGYPFERRVSRFEEALAIIRPLLRGEEVTFHGEFQHAERARLIPKAPRSGEVPIMIGTIEGRPRMARLVVQNAAIWNCIIAFGDSEYPAFERAWQPLLRACEKHDRDASTLERHATVGVNVGQTDYPIPGAVPLSGSTEAIAAQFARFAEHGVEHVSIMPHPWTRDGITRLGRVVEALRR